MGLASLVAATISVSLLGLGAGTASSQDYPSKPIRIITSPAGGGTDFTVRQIAQGISGPLGQQIIVDNRPSGIIQGETVSKAAPDGYTLLIAGGTFWTLPLLQKTTYDPIRDFSPITLIDVSINVVAVHPSVPVKSIRELVALAKARPGELNYASTGSGGTAHLATELFKSMAGVNIVHVPYKSMPAAITDLIGGQVQLLFVSSTSAAPHVKSGKLKAIAVTSTQPSALAPGLPPVATSGVPGYEVVSMTAMFAPAKTPAAIIKRVNEEVVRYLKTPEAKETFFSRGLDAVGSSPEQLAVAMKAEMARLEKVIKETGIRVN